MLHPDFGASLSFIGIPWRVVPFPLAEVQTAWLAKAMSGGVALPSPEEMKSTLAKELAEREQENIHARFTHRGDFYPYCCSILAEAELASEFVVTEDRTLRRTNAE